MQKTVDTRICEVTVYDDQALVTRKGVVQLTGTEQELIVDQLPLSLISESVRASGKGTAVRLLGVRTERTLTTEVIAQNLAQLQQDIEQLEDQKRQGQDLLTLLNLQRNFVKSLSTQYLERLARLANPEPLNLDQIRELLEFIGQQYNEFSSAIAQCDKEQRQLDKQLQVLRQQLQQRSALSAQERFTVIVSIEPSAKGEFELEVNYIVEQINWTPAYDVRFSTTNEKIQLSYLAEVMQSSGEDWPDVALTLSTVKPGLSTVTPLLAPWYIDVQQAHEAGHKAKTGAEAPSPALPTTMPFPGMAPTPESTRHSELERLKAQALAAEVVKQGGIVSLQANRATTIPSDGVPHQITVFTEDYPCHAEYIVIPRIVNLPYLQLTITNPLAGITLLPGKANLFRDNTFIGTTELANITPGQDVQLILGIDEGVKIERNLVERQVDKKLIGNQRQTTYAYRLVVTNLHDHFANVTLTEQLPMSRTDYIKVRLTRCEPQITVSEMGALTWVLTLPPHTQQELYYQFTVEHSPELLVVGLDI